jgi:hypothetical protein
MGETNISLMQVAYCMLTLSELHPITFSIHLNMHALGTLQEFLSDDPRTPVALNFVKSTEPHVVVGLHSIVTTSRYEIQVGRVTNGTFDSRLRASIPTENPLADVDQIASELKRMYRLPYEIPLYANHELAGYAR